MEDYFESVESLIHGLLLDSLIFFTLKNIFQELDIQIFIIRKNGGLLRVPGKLRLQRQRLPSRGDKFRIRIFKILISKYGFRFNF